MMVEIIRSGEHKSWFGTLEEYPDGSKGMKSNKSENPIRPVDTSFVVETNFITEGRSLTAYLSERKLECEMFRSLDADICGTCLGNIRRSGIFLVHTLRKFTDPTRPNLAWRPKSCNDGDGIHVPRKDGVREDRLCLA